MAQPTASGLHIDSALTNYSMSYAQNDDAFIAAKVFPELSVPARSGKYWKFDKADWFRDEAQVRPPATESAGGGYSVSTGTYDATVWAFHKDVNDQEVANADAVFNQERTATRFVTRRMLLRREIEWTTSFFTTSVWGTDITPAALWSNYATSSPMVDIETGKRTIAANTGYAPNTLVLGYEVWSQLVNHPDILDRIKYTTADVIGRDIVARYFGVDRIFVTSALKNTANEGATAAYSFVQGKHALLAYVAPTVAAEEPTAGLTLVWDSVDDGMGVARIEMPLKRAVRIEQQKAWDSVVVASDMGYFFNTVVS